jgi:thioredoxin reductase (NADPH)
MRKRAKAGPRPVGWKVLGVDPRALREVVASYPDISEVILRAFLLRHARLTQLYVGLNVIGARSSVATRQLFDLMMRDRVPMGWLDVESDPETEEVLCHFKVPVEDLPVLITGRGDVLRHPSRDLARELTGSRDGSRVATRVHDLLVIGPAPAVLPQPCMAPRKACGTAMTRLIA